MKTIDEQIKEVRTELLFMGFAAAKYFSQLTKRPNGTMECPLCRKELRYFTSEYNGHFRAVCDTENCINAVE